MPTSDVLSNRALGRATLDRQMLLERCDVSPIEVVEKLVGLQSQTTHSWYIGFWTRLNNFDPEEVSQLMVDRKLVRIVVMRGTIHLLTVSDALFLRPLIQPVLDRALQGSFGRNLVDLDQAAITEFARQHLNATALTFADVGKIITAQPEWKGRDPLSMAQVARAKLALVQTPPRGLWGKSGKAAHMTVEGWLGKSVQAKPSLNKMVTRYLAAFGPASVNDIQAWCGLNRLREVTDKMGSELRKFRNENGVELFDLPDAPRPGTDTPAPVRFMYDYDNLFLSHADRTRFIPEDARGFSPKMTVHGSLMVDGILIGVWHLTKDKKAPELIVELAGKLLKRDKPAIEVEAAELLNFLGKPNAKIRYLSS